MKKIVLTAALALVAVVALPTALASATFVGDCTIQGTAAFGGHKLGAVPGTTPIPYTFTSNGGECKTVEQGFHTFESAGVEGEGILSCTLSAGIPVEAITGKEGKGFIKAGGEEFKFTFNFVAAGGFVNFVAIGKEAGKEVTAAGTATFLNPKGLEALEACAKNEAASLAFEAVAAGSV